MTDPSPEEAPGRLVTLLGRLSGGRVQPSSLAALRGSDTAKAAGLAGAMIANNVIALGSTIVFARLLKDNQGGGYGSLAALISYFLILSVAGQAMQVATARESVLGHLGVGAGLVATVRRWTRGLLLFTLALTVVSVLLRDPIARALNETTPGQPMVLPRTLAELVRSRVGVLDEELQHTLLAAACAATPTVDLVAAAAGTDLEHVERLLEVAEDKAIIAIDGNKLRFAHQSRRGRKAFQLGLFPRIRFDLPHALEIIQ